MLISVPIAQSASIELDSIGGADLLWKRDDGTLIPLPMESMELELEITGFLVRGTIRQVFLNDSEQVIEATYVFPMPERAAVDGMEMRIGTRRIVAEVREKQEARRVYEQAKSLGKKAALVDRGRPNLYRTSVANINPGERVEITVALMDEARFVDGTFRYAFPLVYTPRYIPGDVDETSRPANDAPSIPTVSLDVGLTAGIPFHDLRTPSHPDLGPPSMAGDVRTGIERATFSGAVSGANDFVVEWRPTDGRRPHAAWFLEERDSMRYAMMMLVPAAERVELTPIPSETIFVVDVSGSMAGPSIINVRDALDQALRRLRPDDRFNLIRFNDGYSRYADRFIQADEDGIRDAREWIGRLEAGGGTMIYPALEDALKLAGESTTRHLQRIVFLTDGAIGDEERILQRIADESGKIRIHTLGIGSAPNRHLMRKMAQLGRGIARFVGNGNDPEEQVDRFFAVVDAPLLMDLSIDESTARVLESFPSPLPDLHSGEPLVVAMRLEAGEDPGALLVKAWGPHGGYVETVEPTAAPPHAGIATLWARTRIESLMDRRYFEPNNTTLKEEVIEIALEFNQVTAFTSLVAVEQTPTAIGNTLRRNQTASLPQGGTLDPIKKRLAMLFGLLGIGVLFWLACTRDPA